MNARLAMVAASAVLVMSIGLAPAFGQVVQSVTISTDKESYDAGEQITVTGQVGSILGFGVTIQVFAPAEGHSNTLFIAQPVVNPDGSFEAQFAAGGSLMKWPGEYTIRAEYGGAQRSAETTFQFTGGQAQAAPEPVEDPDITDTTIRVDGSTDLINYQITGGRVLSVTPVQPSSLIIGIEADEDGMITLEIPRTVLDATQDGEDIEFFVLIDAEESDGFEETGNTDTHRTLEIPFSAGSTEIEIIGTFVIPEFGVIAVVVLAAAVLAMVAVTSRSRLAIAPRA
ncbi:MAG: PEFG-CTERM sorting domain-containing protein [Nitrosopumilus sp.]|nr:PEFG-CTERM sorting domain-containing protein [Nitrosopumilus sp.]